MKFLKCGCIVHFLLKDFGLVYDIKADKSLEILVKNHTFSYLYTDNEKLES